MHKSISEKLISSLKSLSFSEAYFNNIKGTPKDIISNLEHEQTSLEKETAKLDEKAKKLTRHIPFLSSLEDYLTNRNGKGAYL